MKNINVNYILKFIKSFKSYESSEQIRKSFQKERILEYILNMLNKDSDYSHSLRNWNILIVVQKIINLLKLVI